MGCRTIGSAAGVTAGLLALLLAAAPARSAPQVPEASPPPAPEVSPTPEASPTPAPEASPTPEASPSPEPDAPTILEKIGTFQDIEDIDLTQLLKVTAGEEGARTADDEPGNVTVLSEEDIRRSGAHTVTEVLQAVAGLEVTRDDLGRPRLVVRGVPAALSSNGSSNVLVYLNGLLLNENLTGGALAVNLDIPVDNVKRIEIVRGPGSVLFGPGAFLAVVNIVTESVDTFRRDELTLGGGSFGTFLYNFRYGTTFHDVSLAGFMQFTRTSGPALDIPEDVQTGIDRALAPLGIRPVSRAPGETVDDGRAVDANIAVAWRDFTLNARLKEENVGGYVGLLDVLGTQNRLSNKQITFDGAWRRTVSIGDLRLRAGYTESRLATFLDVLPPGFTFVRSDAQVVFPSGVALQQNLNSRRLSSEALLDRRLASRHMLTAGLALEREATFGLDAKTNVDFLTRTPLPRYGSVPALVPEASRTVLSAFAQDEWSPTSRLGVTGGLRLDHYTDFGTSVSPRLAAVARFPRNLTLKASYAHARRTPTFAERFYSTPAVQANPLLETASLDTADLGLLFRRKDLRLSGTAYLSRVRDIVGPDGRPTFGSAAFLPRYANLHGIDARGLDLEGSYTFPGNRSLQLVYSLQHAEDAASGERLAEVPTHLLRLSANFAAGKYLILSPAFTAKSARPRALGDPREDLGGYGLFDLVVRGHNFHRAIEVSAVIRDLFGTDYFDPSPLGGLPGDYPRAGRSFFVKAKYRF